ncbi:MULTISPECIES: carnitine 3-dehydrogenase [Mesorhizobium]|uniref:L-carnitine dehydrogenase n=1 Tax=Mesorhizobium denitrificans TaxID=2294114 RepID=A0A371X403_9HYPH|nr:MULTISPECIES: carnitine 3-dehydrogenase [Mesorhizobium]RFC63956.1 carnitine 3-dehydrogenase [Mesorhizobium denitrificans]
MSEKTSVTAAIGGGVIGGGWIARFLLNGHDVNVYDPHPDAQRLVNEVLSNAERALRRMTMAPLPTKGKLTFVSSIAEAVRDADYIQESVPERLDLKLKIFAEIEKHAQPDAMIGSSTSGFRPTQLAEGLKTPERLFVAHPFNPVYLLPVVEVVPSAMTSPAVVERASAFLTTIGMKPLVVRKEIDAHIADRLLEAVWREGLWLVNDGIATTQEIDDVIRFGFGLRWAQMGLFETYRIAGGEAGMAHFIAQFGPALKWPWTKLMDVPEMTDELIATIASQSDAQSGMHSIRELERIRDDNLVAIMQALKAKPWGAGEILKSYEDGLYAKAHAHAATANTEPSGPLALHTDRVREDFVDYNGHMTESRYLQVFGDATDAFLHYIGMNTDYLATGRSMYTVETHIRHLREVKMGEPLRVETRLLGYDSKRARILHELFGGPGDELLATAEHMLLHVDTKKSTASEMGEELRRALANIWAYHKTLETPDYAGKPVRNIATDGL